MRGLVFKAMSIITGCMFLMSGGVARATSPASDNAVQATRKVWDIQRVEDVHELAEKMGDHAAVYDSSGTLHVAYGGDHL